jgi:Putative methyltransferase
VPSQHGSFSPICIVVYVRGRDWAEWHDDYDRPGSSLARRLAAVQERIRDALDQARPGELRAISVCAGQGRDIIGALAGHPRGRDVTARLVELDERIAAVARDSAAAAGLPRVRVEIGDAGLISQYAGMAPADLVLMCGVFGNISDADIERSVGYCTQLCVTGGTVVWTRGRWEPDLVPAICGWYEARGFERLWVSDPREGYGAGAHRFTGTTAELDTGARMFTFTRPPQPGGRSERD